MYYLPSGLGSIGNFDSNGTFRLEDHIQGKHGNVSTILRRWCGASNIKSPFESSDYTYLLVSSTFKRFQIRNTPVSVIDVNVYPVVVGSKPA